MTCSFCEKESIAILGDAAVCGDHYPKPRPCKHDRPYSVIVRTLDPNPIATVLEFTCEDCGHIWKVQKESAQRLREALTATTEALEAWQKVPRKDQRVSGYLILTADIESALERGAKALEIAAGLVR